MSKNGKIFEDVQIDNANLQSQKAVFAFLQSKHIMPFGFARRSLGVRRVSGLEGRAHLLPYEAPPGEYRSQPEAPHAAIPSINRLSQPANPPTVSLSCASLMLIFTL